MEETLTLHRLGVVPLLGRSLSSTNLIESCLGTLRGVTRNVKRWQGGDHIARRTAAGLVEAEKKFRRVKGYRRCRFCCAPWKERPRRRRWLEDQREGRPFQLLSGHPPLFPQVFTFTPDFLETLRRARRIRPPF